MISIYYFGFVGLYIAGFLLFLYGITRIFLLFETSLDCRGDNKSWMDKFRVYWIILFASVAFPLVTLVC